jgi:hypothetical protein
MVNIPVRIFYCYARNDKILRDELGKHLAVLQRHEKISAWCDEQIEPGKEWEDEIKKRLIEADIILLLISPDFLASDYCYKEMLVAIKRHNGGLTRVIPIFVRPVANWESTPFAKLQALPKDAMPITSWINQDEAWRDVAERITGIVDDTAKAPIQQVKFSEITTIPRLKKTRKSLSFLIIVSFVFLAIILILIGVIFEFSRLSDGTHVTPTPTPTGGTKIDSPTAVPTPTPTMGVTPTATPITTATVAPTPVPTQVPVPPPPISETTGAEAHTWTSYSNAGGNEGQVIPSHTTVQITCKVTGFKVDDGNTWWYRIASNPWNNNYYVSADPFYNNGQTQGPLLNTPFVDNAVPNC